MAEINDLSVDAASNIARFPENQLPSTVNNGARTLESIIGRWHKDTNGSVAVAGTNTYTATINADTGFALYDGFEFVGDFANGNTGAATINLTPHGGSALGAKAIKKNVSTALASGDIAAGAKVALIYDGTNFQMMSPVVSTASYSDPLTTRGDLVKRGASATERLAIGSANTVLTSDGTDPSFSTVATAMIANNAIDETKLKDALIGDFTEVTVAAGDSILLADATDSGNTKRDTVQGILDLAGGGAWSFISSTDISSAASFDFTAVDASAYDGYMMYLMNVVPATDATYIWLRTSTDGGSNYDSGGANYGNSMVGVDGSGSIHDQFSATQISLNGDSASDNARIGSASGEDGVSGFVMVHGPHLAKETNVTWQINFTNANGDASGGFFTGAGARQSSADVDAFQVLFSSGNIESGTITVLGLKNS